MNPRRFLFASTIFAITLAMAPTDPEAAPLSWMRSSRAKLEKELAAKYGEGERPRLARGMRQVASFWGDADGDAPVFEAFVRTHFAGDAAARDIVFGRFEKLFEALLGHMDEIAREFQTMQDVDLGPLHPLDEIFSGYAADAHVTEDFFRNKLAFVALLNFPLTTLAERLAQGPEWSRRQWAEARLARLFSRRIPASVNLAVAKAFSEAERYIGEYNIYMHHLLGPEGARLFPPKMKLLSHWNLRDQIRSDYGDKARGLAKQRMIQKVMERIVAQTIPRSVIDNPTVDWDPDSNEVRASDVRDVAGEGKPRPAGADREPDTRYAVLLANFRAAKKVDPHVPTAPSAIARAFDDERELPEKRVRAMFEQVLTSPHLAEVAALLRKRLGRPLEPFDIWYKGFQKNSAVGEGELDRIVAEKYPTAAAFQADIPDILVKLGFRRERARDLAGNILVDAARGSGHARGALMRSAKTRLRTRIGPQGMNYKGFNIAIHELGHNVEQTFSLNYIDHYFLSGVPNTAFTEAVAFVFQDRDLELLGQKAEDREGERLDIIGRFWATAEIAAVALTDMAVWHWMYANPQATPDKLREAVLRISKDVWNRYYAPVFGTRDVVLLGIYSHMINRNLYLPDYPIGHLIAHQIEEHLKKTPDFGAEVERMMKLGRLTPDLWMERATGAPVGPEALLAATAEALEQMRN